MVHSEYAGVISEVGLCLLLEGSNLRRHYRINNSEPSTIHVLLVRQILSVEHELTGLYWRKIIEYNYKTIGLKSNFGDILYLYNC